MSNLFKDVLDFHEKFGLEYDGKPRLLSEEMEEFRFKFMQEELNEYIQACARARILLQNPTFLIRSPELFIAALESIFDSLIDLIYVALGTAALHGFDFNAGWERVQSANMAKERAKSAGDSKRGSSFDVIKPPGWKPPSHQDLLVDHAHKDVLAA